MLVLNWGRVLAFIRVVSGVLGFLGTVSGVLAFIEVVKISAIAVSCPIQIPMKFTTDEILKRKGSGNKSKP